MCARWGDFRRLEASPTSQLQGSLPPLYALLVYKRSKKALSPKKDRRNPACVNAGGDKRPHGLRKPLLRTGGAGHQSQTDGVTEPVTVGTKKHQKAKRGKPSHVCVCKLCGRSAGPRSSPEKSFSHHLRSTPASPNQNSHRQGRTKQKNKKAAAKISPDSKLTIALVNDGKLSAVRSLVLCEWVDNHHVDICFVSEAAHPSRTALPTDPGYEWAAPLGQRKGGSGFLLRTELASSCKTRLLQAPDNTWSIAEWHTRCKTLFISAYITPEASRTLSQLCLFLAQLHTCSSTSAKCIIGGDLNAAMGTRHREVQMTAGGASSDLDLC